ncbi:MAG TPA: DMT family transporter [Vitreimonas sp.]|uniref:DMT family transporter n=1 Tax=Vitreimonas sp. TaxID=3069702 RepID=UPI002D2C278A|nr:DMT family transporter [Vitreimonas sp.]HYD88170.1 DMT family transporter [Vitreimonas sp.]
MPLLAVAAALSSALIHASWNAALKGGRDRVSDAFLVAVGGLLTGGAIIAVLGVPPAGAWPYLAASVAIHVLYWFTLFKGYDAGDLSHIYTLSRGSAPLLVALGAALTVQEIPSPLKLLGIALVSLGVLAVGASPRAPLQATLWALATGACISSYSLVDALGARVTGNAVLYLGWTTALMSVPMVAYTIWRRGSRELMKSASIAPWRGIAIGAISFAGYGLVLWAQTFAPIAQVTALRETSVVWGALIAFFFLGERLGLRRWLGAIVVAGGAGLIAFA